MFRPELYASVSMHDQQTPAVTGTRHAEPAVKRAGRFGS